MSKFFNDTRYAIAWGIFGLLILSVFGSALLLTKTFSEFNKIENPQGYPNTITVTGKGEAVAIPDVATFSYSVVETSESVASAQKLATEKANKVLAFLKESGVEEKDLKTTGYNIYPKYEWIQPVCHSEINCPRGKNELVGYEVNQSVRVKVRDTQKAGEILSGIGKFEVSNVSGLNFEVDDEDIVTNEALKLAIEDAKSNAKVLAKNLGVRLGKIMTFSEGYDGPMYDNSAYGLGGAESIKATVVPEIPKGENTYAKTVYITYELK